MPQEETAKKQSENLVWVVQILFGLVFAQSLLLYRDILLDPFSPDNAVMFLALVTVYVSTLISWKDFSLTMSRNPYGGRRIVGDFRFYADVIIVAMYSITMFSINSLSKSGNKELYVFLLCYTIIYSLYLVSGVIRIIEYGWLASRYKLITAYLILFTLCYFAYSSLASVNGISTQARNTGTILFVLGLIVSYRVIRWILFFKQKREKDKGLRIAIDIDGVLANQIDYLLPIIKRKYAVELSYEDIKTWDMAFADTNIKEFIEQYQVDDPEYIRTMQITEGAKYYTDKMYKENRILIITARDERLNDATKKWLQENKVNFDEYINKRGKSKTDYHFDVLVDDFPGNFAGIAVSDRRLSILFEQPWNKNDRIRTDKPFIKIADSWKAVFEALVEFKATQGQK